MVLPAAAKEAVGLEAAMKGAAAAAVALEEAQPVERRVAADTEVRVVQVAARMAVVHMETAGEEVGVLAMGERAVPTVARTEAARMVAPAATQAEDDAVLA